MSGLKKNPTQCERLIKHFEEHKTITAYEAVIEYGILELAARIYELEKKGYVFEKKRKTSKNRYGESISYTVYSIAETDVGEKQ